MRLPRGISGPEESLFLRSFEFLRGQNFKISKPARTILTVALTGALLIFAFSFWPTGKYSYSVPTHSSPEQLDPQVREYIARTAEWVRQQPWNEERQTTLGFVYAANALWNEAGLSFSNVARMNPDQPLAFVYMAAAAQENADMGRAAELLRTATQRFPYCSPAWNRLGELALRTGDTNEAHVAFSRLTELAPEETRGWAGLGAVNVRMGDFSSAVKNLEKAIRLDPENKGAHNLLGTALRGLGKMAEAEIEMKMGAGFTSYPMPDEWSEQIPQHMRLVQDQLDVANMLGQCGEGIKAVALLEQALAYHPQHLGLLNNLGIALNRAGQPDKAAAVVTRALQVDTNYLPAMITLAFSEEARNQHVKALATAERAIAVSPRTAQAHLAKANALLGMERDSEALQALEKAFESDPQNGDIQVEMGDVLWRNLQKPDQAVEHYRMATNLNPILSAAHIRIADYHLRDGNTNAAAPILNLLGRIAPNNPEVVFLQDRWRNLCRAN